MPGIGMMKYSWKQPPVFFSEPGDYDYMTNATKYIPKDISGIEKSMKEILTDIYSVINYCDTNLYFSTDMFVLEKNWNSLFIINDEEQEVLDSEKILNIGLETENSYKELDDTVSTYFEDAKTAIKNITSALEKIEATAKKVENARKQLNNKDEGMRNAAKTYLENVRKNGKIYNYFNLSKIGKWVY